MKAEVKSKFGRGFFLSEESILKIVDIITNRFGSENEFDLKCLVSRIDHAKIEYATAAEVLQKEDNSKTEKVSQLTIMCESATSSASVIFETGESTRLQISSQDRDKALLLSAELKEYLKNEVFIRILAFLHRALQGRNVLLVTIGFPLLFLIFAISFLKKTASIDLNTSSIDQKINFLVTNAQSREIFDQIPVYFAAIGVFVICLFLVTASSAVRPVYTFYFGKEVQKYDGAETIRGRIFWGVIVAAIVGTMAAYFSKKAGI